MHKYCGGDFNIKELGSFYSKESTSFKVFAPESKEVFLFLNDNKIAMQKEGCCFTATVNGDLEKTKYYFENDLGISYRDPLAYYSDEKYSYVLDKSKFIKECIKPKAITDIVIYETNVRDFSCDNAYLGGHKRKLLALAESNIKQYDYYVLGLDYLKNIGVSHLQLMPIFSFDKDNSDYNWGYNPLAYNYLHADYIEDNNNPYAYINEFRKVVNTLHENNIRVNLDVVFNHVYKYENYDLDKMLGDHAFRRMADGSLAKGTLCGNEINSEDPFVRAYLVEMSTRYIELFDIDGLRVDLMGILDYETVNLISDSCKKMKDDFIVYGEGWNMGDKLDESLRASIVNHNKLPGIYMFNDMYRDTLTKYLCGNYVDKEMVKKCLAGNSEYLTGRQSINYIECHDGYTFFDRLMKDNNDLDNNIRKAKLGMGLILISKGVPFIQMGQEFLRTKHFISNSYNSNESINKIDWNRRIEYNYICDYFKGLVELRREYGLNRISGEFIDYYECLIYKSEELFIIINPCMWDHTYEDGNNYEVIYDLNGKNCYTSSILSIPAYSLLICKR